MWYKLGCGLPSKGSPPLPDLPFPSQCQLPVAGILQAECTHTTTLEPVCVTAKQILKTYEWGQLEGIRNPNHTGITCQFIPTTIK